MIKLSWISVVFVIISAVVLLADGAVFTAIKSRMAHLDERYLGYILHRFHQGDFSSHKMPEDISKDVERNYTWMDDAGDFLSIAHALGPTEPSGSNTLDTFFRGLKLGFQFFEVDLTVTTDGSLICFHGDNEQERDHLSLSQYLSLAKNSGYKPCFFSDLVAILREHPDIYLVLDVKNRFSDIYSLIRSSVSEPAVSQRLIPQIYNFDQLKIIRADDFFLGEIFTSYLTAMPTSKILNYARLSGIRAVTLTLGRVRNYQGRFPNDVSIYTHPVNDPMDYFELKRIGIKGIYTHYLTGDYLSKIGQ